MKLSNGKLAAIIIALVIVIDQAVKIWVKTHFYYGEEVMVTSWFRLLFIENNGKNICIICNRPLQFSSLLNLLGLI